MILSEEVTNDTMRKIRFEEFEMRKRDLKEHGGRRRLRQEKNEVGEIRRVSESVANRWHKRAARCSVRKCRGREANGEFSDGFPYVGTTPRHLNKGEDFWERSNGSYGLCE